MYNRNLYIDTDCSQWFRLVVDPIPLNHLFLHLIFVVRRLWPIVVAFIVLHNTGRLLEFLIFVITFLVFYVYLVWLLFFMSDQICVIHNCRYLYEFILYCVQAKTRQLFFIKNNKYIIWFAHTYTSFDQNVCAVCEFPALQVSN